MPNITETLGLPTTQPANILLVDNQPANVKAFRVILKDLGHNLVEANSAEDARKQIASTDFAVILLDTQMSNIDEFKIAKLIRGQERSRYTPLIFHTAPESNGLLNEEQAYALGAVDYLVRPLVPSILRAKVTWFVELYRKARRLDLQAEAERRTEATGFEEVRLREELRKIQETEERLTMMVESVKEYAFFSLDVSGHITSWNLGAEHLLGYDEDEILGKHFSLFFIPEDIETGRPDRELRQAVTEGAASNNNWIVRKNASRFWAEGSTYPLRHGELRGFATIFRDLTERKQMEEELRANAEALVETDRRRSEFLAMLGHELRNPLAPIVTSLAVVRQDKTVNPLVKEAHSIIERQIEHLIRLVDDLLDMARITRGRIELRKERVELNDLIHWVVDAVEPLVAARQHEFSVSAPQDVLWLDVDPARIQQALVNLLSNACKYTPAHGVIQLTAHLEGDKVVISVKDNGVGIALDVLPKVFDLFTQGERSLARSEGGLGIGLTMVKSLVEMHGGSAVARSKGQGNGSEFIILLPLAKPETSVSVATPSRTTQQPQVPFQKALRILIVDDNVDAAKSLALLLRVYGYEIVDVVHDGPSAVNAILTKKPSVVLLDIGLPGMNGYEVARRVHEKQIMQRPHLIAVSGYGTESDKLKAQEVGIDNYLVKPVDPGQLHEILSGIVERSA